MCCIFIKSSNTCMALIFTEDIVLLQNILKKLENVERSLHAYHEKMDGNISKTSEEVVNPPVSSLKKPGGTNVMKMTKFMVGTINILIVNIYQYITWFHDKYYTCLYTCLYTCKNKFTDIIKIKHSVWWGKFIRYIFFALISFSLFRDKFNIVKNKTCNYYIGYYLLYSNLYESRKKWPKQILNFYSLSFIFAKFATQENPNVYRLHKNSN